MRTDFTPPAGVKGTPIKLALAVVIACVLSLANSAPSANASGLPGPTFTQYPLGQVLDTTAIPIGFELSDLSGGALLGYVCTLDGVDLPCNGTLELVGLAAGTHDLAVKAQISVFGSNPVCVMGICLPPVGLITIDTDVSHLLLDVTSGSPGDTGASGGGSSGANGAAGSNGTPGANGTAATASSAWLATNAALTAQTKRCMKLKKKLKKHFSKRSNRARARKRYLSCVKVQRKLARQLASMG
jgi:hypothetical protein